jgi:hypothetical protein
MTGTKVVAETPVSGGLEGTDTLTAAIERAGIAEPPVIPPR